tara:strand:+ start:1716 stop:3455 length:1740 start_codon:yes stop_codon:yes gene_type:complete
MKKILLSTLFIIPFLISSQEMDQDYLNSLPESVKKGVLSKNEAKDDLVKPIYRSASTSVDKKVGVNFKDIFGSKFFDTIQSSFMPINEPNFDSSYILDFGDVLEIQLIGQKDIIKTYPIIRDGSVNIPEIGKIFLSGLSLNNASNLIKAKISNTFIGTEAYISLKNIRDITILIAGNAYNPGIYTLNGNSNVLHALNMAGGIDSIGSYRDINIIRNGEIIDTLDIYEIMIEGKNNFNTSLRSGDSIVVKPVSNIVSIESGVLRPAKYELRKNETLYDLLKYANGLSVDADKSNILVKRMTNGKIGTIKVNYEDLSNFNIVNGDSLYIREYKLNTVLIEGAVVNPGEYKVEKGATLSQLIYHAGGYDSGAYPFAGYLENQEAYKVNEQAKDKLYEAFLSSLISNSGSRNPTKDGNLELILELLKESSITGRIVAEFDLDVIKSNAKLDTFLQDKDRILIPYLTEQVYIQGEISTPGAIRYEPGKDIKYYINKSGGILNDADLNKIFIIHPNGESENLSSKSRLSFLSAEENKQLIYPGSIIYIPRSASTANGLEVASIWAPIISSVALSMTSLSVLNNSN